MSFNGAVLQQWSKDDNYKYDYNKQYNFFNDNIMKHFTYIKNPYLNWQYGNSQIMNQKNTYKGGLRDLPNMPKLRISLKPLALAQNSNNFKKKTDLNTCQDSTIAYYLVLALLMVNLFQPLVAGNVNCSGKYRFLDFKYLQMIT